MTRTAHEETASRSGAQIEDKTLVLHRLPRSSFKLTCTDIEADRKGGRACALGLLIRLPSSAACDKAALLTRTWQQAASRWTAC